ncbi:MAG: hemolysin III family protein [Geothrix sp.]|uniref:PAQR family membrane homeostasis protein TrhA n=1 Tax=Geothrix sp. TaxID=1962974 RepID=UPI00183CDF84|nr:hemolysin III family protein [Geothrix sp.]NWJ40818.1 hemolysin III family protein [Geothrix sp.]WIL21180.1 MAG: hemolysin III family protein [Geothrix sp.]
MALQLSTDPFVPALPAPRPAWWHLSQDEWLNSLTHLLGLLLALPGTAFLIGRAVMGGDALKLVSFGIFGLSMIALYAASTLFHSAQGPAKERWAKADHCAIYLLIAGTYTPFALVTLRGPLGWGLFAFVWALAALGIAKELWWDRSSLPAVPLYLLMGWCGLAAGLPLARRLQGQGLKWLLAGCLLYSIGVAFYLLGRRVRHAHGIWHLFVLGGTASHFITVLRFV